MVLFFNILEYLMVFFLNDSLSFFFFFEMFFLFLKAKFGKKLLD
jgi:hypothetical protein